MSLKRKMIQCSSKVNKKAIRREVINGVEFVIVSSFTLPDNVVMNGGLYPAEEIANSFETLEGTLAPIEHPVDAAGNFILATEAYAIDNFYAGASNKNVTREDGRVHIEKHINVQEAMKSERGKRLMDRIVEIETNDSARPIHTSTGLLLAVEQLKEPKVNKAGDKYTWIAREMVFDHDAILLDSVAAATPDKGVGIAVNKEGDEIDVEIINVDKEDAALCSVPVASIVRVNVEGMSQADLHEQLHQAIKSIIASEWMYVVDVFDDMVIFETNQGYFQVPYRVDNGTATVVGIPLRVEKDVTYTPKTNEEIGDIMNELIINALKGAGVETEGLDDAALFAAYNKLKDVAAEPGTDAEAITAAVNAALTPFTEQIEGLKTQLNSKDVAEVETLATVVGNSDKFPGMSVDSAKLVPVTELRDMAAACGHSVGIPTAVNFDASQDDAYSAPKDMPKGGES